MSQQEFFQGPQEQQPLDDEAISYPQQPYYWSARPNAPNAPKEEPASRYDEPMLQEDYQSGYVAQDTMAHSYQQSTDEPPGTRSSSFQGQAQSQKQQQKQQFSPDGDAFERQYHPYGSYNRLQWGVPWWARPQRQHRRWPRTVLLLLAAVLLIKPLLILLALFGVILLAILIPFALVLMIVLPFILLRIVTGRSFPRRRWRYTSYWRGRWW